VTLRVQSDQCHLAIYDKMNEGVSHQRFCDICCIEELGIRN
jgi:hypothetical protein